MNLTIPARELRVNDEIRGGARRSDGEYVRGQVTKVDHGNGVACVWVRSERPEPIIVADLILHHAERIQIFRPPTTVRVKAEVSITLTKSGDARVPVKPTLSVEIDGSGDRLDVDLTSDDLVRLLSGSVMTFDATVQSDV